MNDDRRSSTEQLGTSEAMANSEFMKKFEAVIARWAEATSADKAEEAQEAALEALSLAGEEALRNPTPSLLLREEADNLETKGEWSAAEAARRKVLTLDESAGNFGMIAKAQMDLCGLLRLVGRMDEAWQFACAATISARRAEIFPVLVMALEREAFCALDRGDLVKALAAASEAVQVIKPGKVHDGIRARALTTRARCLLAHGNLSEAELDLDSSWELLQARSGLQMLPGPIFTLANWWEVKSQLEATQGNLASAREAITRAIGYGRQLNGPHALLGLARALEKLGEISRMGGDWSAEERAMREARSIREELHLPCSA